MGWPSPNSWPWLSLNPKQNTCSLPLSWTQKTAPAKPARLFLALNLKFASCQESNEFAFLATARYGKPLLNQNGAPIRLVVPWKYGFKGAKSLVRIDFVADQPKTLWNQMAPNENGFYANVNPEVDIPAGA